MGAWGPAIFSDDLACDIRGDYRDLLEDGVADAEATKRIIKAYDHLDADEAHVLWLALAAAQAGLGRLDAAVRDKALAVIDAEVGLDLWAEAGPKELAGRKVALATLRDTLTGEQKPPSKVRRPWAHVTGLVPGDVLALALPDGRLALFRVARLDPNRVGTAPVLRRLDWAKSTLPSRRKLGRLKAEPDPGPNTNRATEFRVAKHRKKDDDWPESGFELVARVDTHRDDAACSPRLYTSWSGLREGLMVGWLA
jgi:hypothetical protein